MREDSRVPHRYIYGTVSLFYMNTSGWRLTCGVTSHVFWLQPGPPGGDCHFFLFHNPVHERPDTVPNLYVDLISTPHKLLGRSDEPHACWCAGENDRAMSVHKFSGVGKFRSGTYPGRKVVPCERNAMIFATPKIMCLHCPVSVQFESSVIRGSLRIARLDSVSIQSCFQVDNLRVRDRLRRHDCRSEGVCVIEPFAKTPALAT